LSRILHSSRTSRHIRRSPAMESCWAGPLVLVDQEV
jgi:hypothetical protein